MGHRYGINIIIMVLALTNFWAIDFLKWKNIHQPLLEAECRKES